MDNVDFVCQDFLQVTDVPAQAFKAGSCAVFVNAPAQDVELPGNVYEVFQFPGFGGDVQKGFFFCPDCFDCVPEGPGFE